MPAATEIALIFLKADATIEDASSPAGQHLRKCMDFVAGQKGFQRQYYGRQLEDPRLLVWTLDWVCSCPMTRTPGAHAHKY